MDEGFRSPFITIQDYIGFRVCFKAKGLSELISTVPAAESPFVVPRVWVLGVLGPRKST